MGLRKRDQKSKMAGEDNWLITSLIVIVMIILLVSIIAFLVAAFTGETFFQSVCPACPVTGGASSQQIQSKAMPTRIEPTIDLSVVADVNAMNPVKANAEIGKSQAAVDANIMKSEAERENRIVQVLYIDGKPVATQSRILTSSAPAPLPEPDPAPAVATSDPIITFDPDKPLPEKIAVIKPEQTPDPITIAQTAALFRKNARLARTKSRHRANGSSALFDQTTDTLTPAQAAAVTAVCRARVADANAKLAANALEEAGQPVPERISEESLLPPSVKSMALDATLLLPPPISAAGPLSGSIISSSTRIRQILRLVDVTLLSAINEPITLGADVLCVAMSEQQLQPRILATSRSLASSVSPSPWPFLSESLDPVASSSDKPNAKPPVRGNILWRGDPITIKNGLQPVHIISTLIRPADSAWTSEWALRLELADPLTGVSLAGSCARIT